MHEMGKEITIRRQVVYWPMCYAGNFRQWLVVLLAGVAIVPVGLPLAAWYWFRVRPELQSVERGEL